MKIEQIFARVTSKYPGLAINKNWGERGLFYNPGKQLTLGAYMLTFKEKDGQNDSASNITRRPDVFRMNMKISKESFVKLFGSVPGRPAAGGVVATGHDFQKLDTIMPHPVYGWMTWICVLNPSLQTIEHMESIGLFNEAYSAAVKTFDKRTGSKSAAFFPVAPSPAAAAALETPKKMDKKRTLDQRDLTGTGEDSSTKLKL